MEKKNFPCIKVDAKKLKKFDGINKNIKLNNVNFDLAIDEASMQPFEGQIKYYLDTEGDLIIISISFYKGLLQAICSSKRTLKESAKHVLKDVFHIRNSSALRNFKENSEVLKLPLLVNGKQAELTGVRYSFAKAHQEMFPGVDFTVFESAKSYTEKVLDTLSDEDFAIIYEDYYGPDRNEYFTYDDSNDCYVEFNKICSSFEESFKTDTGLETYYPKGREVVEEREEEVHFNRGNVLIIIEDGQIVAKFTMHNYNYS